MFDLCLGIIMTLISCAVCFVIEKRCSRLLVEKEQEILRLKADFKIYQATTEMELKFYKTTVEEQDKICSSVVHINYRELDEAYKRLRAQIEVDNRK